MKILYIIGSGRSGTTLLDIILGNQEGSFSAGELNRFAKRKGIPHDARDEQVSEFWSKVKSELNYDLNRVYKISSKLEYHTGFIKQLFVSNEDKKYYANFNKDLHLTIKKNLTNYQIIIDSSKYPMRAKNLSKLFKDEISYIYIKRSPTDIVESFQKKTIEQPSKNRWKANFYLLIVNTLAIIVVRRLKRKKLVSVISYDDLVKNPIDVLSKIENDLDITLRQLKNKVKLNQPLGVGLLFDGNRLRLNKEIIIQKKKEDKKQIHWVNKIFYPFHKLFWYKF